MEDLKEQEVKTQETLVNQENSSDSNKQEQKEKEIDWKELVYRYAAELDNCRKRLEREIKAREIEIENRIISLFVPVLDDISHLLNHRKDNAASMIISKINKLFDKTGLEEIRPIESETFTEQYHECVAVIETEKEEYNNKIASVVQHGYIYKGRVVKPAAVIVYKYVKKEQTQ